MAFSSTTGMGDPNLGKRYNPFGFMGNLGKVYKQASPYLSLLQGGGGTKGLVEGGLDMAANTMIPGYSQLKMFNQMTGGVNLNKMLGIKNPLSSLSSGIFGGKKNTAAPDPYMAALGRYQAGLAGQQSAAAEQIRSAAERRSKIAPMQDKAEGELMDILTGGLSSRQLAPIYGEGVARNAAIGRGAEAALAQRIASRGVGGGVQAGMEQANLAAAGAREASLNNAITAQQIQQRPQQLATALSLLGQRDQTALQEQLLGQQAQTQALEAGMSAEENARQFKMRQDAIAAANRQNEMEDIGSLLRMAQPELKKAYDQYMASRQNRGVKPTPITSADVATDLGREETMGAGRADQIVAGLGEAGRRQQVAAGQAGNALAGLGGAMMAGSNIFGQGRSQPEPFDFMQAQTGGQQMGPVMPVTDMSTRMRIDAAMNQMIEEDTPDGMRIQMYKDPMSGRYLKRYISRGRGITGMSPNEAAALMGAGSQGIELTPEQIQFGATTPTSGFMSMGDILRFE
jgi:hypothetical protein